LIIEITDTQSFSIPFEKTYDELGCDFNAPGNYQDGVFETCEGKDAQDVSLLEKKKVAI